MAWCCEIAVPAAATDGTLVDSHDVVSGARILSGPLERQAKRQASSSQARPAGPPLGGAASMRVRSRPIPVIMFTAHTNDLAEAQMGVSERSKKAAFVGFLSKPFDLRVLVEIVARVVEDPAAVRALVAFGPRLNC